MNSSYKANLIFYNSGLERKERENVFKDAGGIWDYETFNKIILDRYEQKHELDCSMVEKHIKIVDDLKQQRPMLYTIHKKTLTVQTWCAKIVTKTALMNELIFNKVFNLMHLFLLRIMKEVRPAWMKDFLKSVIMTSFGVKMNTATDTQTFQKTPLK